VAAEQSGLRMRIMKSSLATIDSGAEMINGIVTFYPQQPRHFSRIAGAIGYAKRLDLGLP